MKRKKSEKNRKKRNRVILLLCLILGVVWWNKNDDSEIKQAFSYVKSEVEQRMSKDNDNIYEVKAPKTMNEEEIEETLGELAAQDKQFEAIYEDRKQYPIEVLSALCNNPEMVSFVKDYLNGEKTQRGGINNEELAADIPLLLQWDARWGYAPYGESNIGMSGCAPTCLSMVVVGLTKQKAATPYAIAKYATEQGYYLKGTGTSWSLMTEGSMAYNVCGKEICLDKSIMMNELEAGHPIICSVREGDFTTQGHFIVLTGIKEGKITVNDPNSTYRSKKLWDYDCLAGQIKNLWAFSKIED